MIMAYKYLYIDDVKDNNEIGVINGLKKGGHLEVDFMQPQEWDKMFQKEINGVQNEEYLPSKLESYNGLILDLRLYDNANKEGYTATYRGSTVAQELRTLVKEKTISKDIPIVLITANENIDTSLDETGKDLFDTIVKRSNIGEGYNNLRNELVSLARGYVYINENEKTINSFLSYVYTQNIDFRFVQSINEIKDLPTHVITRFIAKNILRKPSFLIDEYYLSSRLGVSMESEDWVKLKEVLSSFKFNGVFSDYYERWWMNDIESWWESISNDNYLRALTSKERVELLVDALNLKLSHIEKTPRSTSEKFWTVFKVTKAAIDNVDGFIIANQEDNFPWQEKEYISKEEALRPTNKDLWKDVAMIDKDRLEKLKSLLEREETREKKSNGK
jgi:hypothetical protein